METSLLLCLLLRLHPCFMVKTSLVLMISPADCGTIHTS